MKQTVVKCMAILACALSAIGFSACDYLPNLNPSSSQPSIGSPSGNLTSNEKATECLLFIIRTEADGSYAAQIVGYDGTDTDVVIPSVLSGYPVKTIGKDAFKDCREITSITIPGSVTLIGSSAFAYCSGLTSITIPDSVTSIGDSAFYGCSGLTSITIPDSVTSIGDWAFSECIVLTSVTIGNSVTSIGSYSFLCDSGLTSVYYKGTKEDWYKINNGFNATFPYATRYYYSETQPTTTGNYWHYDESGNIVVW